MIKLFAVDAKHICKYWLLLEYWEQNFIIMEVLTLLFIGLWFMKQVLSEAFRSLWSHIDFEIINILYWSIRICQVNLSVNNEHYICSTSFTRSSQKVPGQDTLPEVKWTWTIMTQRCIVGVVGKRENIWSVTTFVTKL